MNMIMHDGAIRQDVAWIGRPLRLRVPFSNAAVGWLDDCGGGVGGEECRGYESVRLREYYECDYICNIVFVA